MEHVLLKLMEVTVEYNLLPGQQMVIDTGYLAMMDATCKMDIQSVPGFKK